jgi:hypothetical protein
MERSDSHTGELSIGSFWPLAAIQVMALWAIGMTALGDSWRSMKGIANQRQEASALLLVAGIGLEMV